MLTTPKYRHSKSQHILLSYALEALNPLRTLIYIQMGVRRAAMTIHNIRPQSIYVEEKANRESTNMFPAKDESVAPTSSTFVM